MAITAAEVFRDYETDGVPSSGTHKVKKSDARSWGAWIESFINAFTSGGGLIYASKAAMDADLAHGANSMAWVIGDATTANNGVYGKVGASGTGSWTRRGDLPFSFIVGSDIGAGTANAIQATTSIPVSGSALVWTNVFEANTGSPVTISFNGEAALTIKTNSGNDIAPGGLVAGMIVLGIVSGTTFRLVSDHVSAASAAAAEAAAAAAAASAEEAANYAAFAKNNWLIALSTVGTSTPQTDFALLVDPGSANNMFVSIRGVLQDVAAYDLIYVGGAPYIRLDEPLPEFVSIEVRVGNAVDVGTPSDGTVTTAKLANKAVTLSKFQDITTQRFLGRLTAGDGPPELLTAAQLQSLLAASGTIVDSVTVRNTTTVALSAAILPDGTIPQITEGTEVLTVTVTPKAVGNKYRIRFRAFGSVNSGPSTLAYGIFRAGSANALDAGGVTIGTAGYIACISGEVEYVVAAVAAHTFSVRVGSQTGVNSYLNGSSASQTFGTAGGATLVVEEIKG